jgi:hypothetical protein
MRLARPLQRLEAEEENEFMQLVQQEKLDLKRMKTTPPQSKMHQNQEQLESLGNRTAEMQTELRLKKEMEAGFARSIQARMALYEADLSSAERKARDAERLRLRQLLGQHCCAEISTNWREEATFAFSGQYRATKEHAEDFLPVDAR